MRKVVMLVLAVGLLLSIGQATAAAGGKSGGASKDGSDTVDIWSRDGGSLGDDGSDNTDTTKYNPDAYICRNARQVNSLGYEYVAEGPEGAESGSSMNKLCGRAADVLLALEQADPARFYWDLCNSGAVPRCSINFGVWVENAQPTPRELAQMLRESLQLHAPDAVRTSPVPNRLYVRFPTWFWLEGGPGVAEPISKATPDGVVKVEAVPTFEWSTGEGVVTCPNKGTPYDAARYDAGAESPTCGHTYARPGRYTLTVTVTWTFTWYLNGNEQGALPATNYSVSADIAVNEIQGIVTDVR
jgi:hypothetical protein